MFLAIGSQVRASEAVGFGVGLDGIQQADARQRLVGSPRVAVLRLEKTAASVPPTADVCRAGRVEPVVAGVGVGMDVA